MDRIRGITLASLVTALMLGSFDAAAAKTAKGPKTPIVETVTPSVLSEPAKIFKEATFLLPKGIKIAPRWVVPPIDSTLEGARFAIDRDGNPVIGWQSSSAYTLLYPTKEYQISLNPSISGFLYLDNGVMLLASGNRVGNMAPHESKKFDEKKLPKGDFQPITAFPLKSIDAIGKSGNIFYCAGMSTKTKRYSLYALRSLKGGGVIDTELMYESEGPINAIGANEESVYVAKGQEIVQIGIKEGNATTLYVHPSERVIDIAPIKGGIVIGTATEVVYVGPNGTMEIIRSTGHRIMSKEDTLFLFFQKSLGILAFDDFSKISGFNLSVKPARYDKTIIPLSINGVNFFESSQAPYTQKIFAKTFDKKTIRRIVAQIDLKSLVPVKKKEKHTLTASWYEPAGGRLLNRSYPIVLKPGEAVQPLFISIGEENDIKGYVPRSKGRGGLIWRLGKDALGGKYPGEYRLNLQIDGIAIGEWTFTVTGDKTFIDAVFYDDLASIKTILDQTPVNQCIDADGNGFLNMAIEYGSVDAVKLVISKGVNPNTPDKKGEKPLERFKFSIPEAKQKMELLIQNGANVNDVYGPDQDPIIFSIYDADIVALMIRHGADIYKKEKKWDRSILDKIMFDNYFGCSDELLSLLVERGVDLNRKNPKYAPLSYLGSAIERGDLECVERLLKQKISLGIALDKAYSQPERSALYLALKKLNERASGQYNIKWSPEDIAKSRKIVRLLMDRGAKLIPGKKHAATNYFEAQEKWYSNVLTTASTEAYARYMQESDLVRLGEGRIMFEGESPSFFSREEMVKMIDVDNAALEEASRYKDVEIRQIALYTHLERVREIVGIAKSSTYLYTARDHCNEAFKIAETGYQAMQVSYIPDTVSVATKDLSFLPRERGGVYVHKTIPQSAAEKAGLSPGDIIVAIDTQQIKNGEEFKAAFTALTPGMPALITFLRAKPLAVPELPLTCGILEYARKEKATAQMYLGQWLVSKPPQEDVDKISNVLEEVFKSK